MRKKIFGYFLIRNTFHEGFLYSQKLFPNFSLLYFYIFCVYIFRYSVIKELNRKALPGFVTMGLQCPMSLNSTAIGAFVEFTAEIVKVLCVLPVSIETAEKNFSTLQSHLRLTMKEAPLLLFIH